MAVPWLAVLQNVTVTEVLDPATVCIQVATPPDATITAAVQAVLAAERAAPAPAEGAPAPATITYSSRGRVPKTDELVAVQQGTTWSGP